MRIRNAEDWWTRANQVRAPSWGDWYHTSSPLSLLESYISGSSSHCVISAVNLFLLSSCSLCWLFFYTCAYQYFIPLYLSLLISQTKESRCLRMCCCFCGYPENTSPKFVFINRLRGVKQHWLSVSRNCESWLHESVVLTSSMQNHFSPIKLTNSEMW